MMKNRRNAARTLTSLLLTGSMLTVGLSAQAARDDDPSRAVGAADEAGAAVSDGERRQISELAAGPLAQTCRRLGLQAGPMMTSLPLEAPAQAYATADAFAAMLAQSVALDGPVPLFGAILSLRNFPHLGDGPGEMTRWLDHLKWLGLEPRIEDVGGQTELARRLRRASPDKLSMMLSALGHVHPLYLSLGEAQQVLGQLEGLSLDDLRHMSLLLAERATERPDRSRSAADMLALMQEIQAEGRWRTAQTPPVPPVHQPFSFSMGQPTFGAAPCVGNFQPAGAGGGGLSEHAREALATLERRVPDGGEPASISETIEAVRHAITASIEDAPAPSAQTPKEARRRRQHAARALEGVDRLEVFS